MTAPQTLPISDMMTNYSPLALASELMTCESITPHDGGVMGVLQRQLEGIGFTVWREIFTDDEEEPTANLYARYGNASPNLCFAGHVDVVPPGDEAQWSTPPFTPTVKEGWLYGRGAEDMKGAIGSFVAAAAEVIRSGNPLNGSISLLITGDEEGTGINGTKKMLKWLEEKGEAIDACLVGEPTNPEFLGEMVKIGRRGSLSCDLIVSGKQGHVAYPHLADNPLTKLINTLNEMQNYMLDTGSEFFPPSNLEVTTVDVNNDTVNLIPSSAHAKFNIRFNDQHTSESIIAWIHDVCDRHAGKGQYELRPRVSGEAFITRDEKLTSCLVKSIIDVTGHTPTLSTTGGTSDARFIKNVCPVIEFGTTGLRAHQVDERVEIATLDGLRDVYVHFLKAYL